MDVVRVRHASYNKAAYNLSEAYFHDIEAVICKFTSDDSTVLVDNAMKAVEAELADTFPPKALDLAFKISQLVGGGRWSWEALVGTQLNSALEVFGSLETDATRIFALPIAVRLDVTRTPVWQAWSRQAKPSVDKTVDDCKSLGKPRRTGRSHHERPPFLQQRRYFGGLQMGQDVE